VPLCYHIYGLGLRPWVPVHAIPPARADNRTRPGTDAESSSSRYLETGMQQRPFRTYAGRMRLPCPLLHAARQPCKEGGENAL